MLRSTKRLLLLMILLSYVPCVLAADDAAFRPLPETLQAAWTKAGFEPGLVSADASGRATFKAATEQPAPGDLPAFRIKVLSADAISSLPSPDQPFALDLNSAEFNGDSAAIVAKQIGKLQHLVRLDLSGTTLDDAGLETLSPLTELQTLSIGKTKITDAGMKSLTRMTALRSLDLNHTETTDATLDALGPLKQLSNLNLFATRVSDAGLVSLAPLTKLHRLNIGSVRTLVDGKPQALSDEGLKSLAAAGLPELELIDLDAARVTDAGLKYLANIWSLQTLYLPSTKVTGTGLSELNDLPKLQTLVLAGDPVTDESISGVASLKQLRTLNLSRTLMTDAGLKKLESLEQLKSLSVTRTKVTDAGVAQLKQARPGLDVKQ